MAGFGEPEALGADHQLDGFDCGEPSLDVWLCRYARQAAGAGSARTFVTVDDERRRVVGYYALAVGSVEHAEASERLTRGMPRHPIPVILLARLAVDRSVQTRGLGAWLLADAMRRSLAAAEQVGIRALLVHALNDHAQTFYLGHGMSPAGTDQRHLMILMKEIRVAIQAARSG